MEIENLSSTPLHTSRNETIMSQALVNLGENANGDIILNVDIAAIPVGYYLKLYNENNMIMAKLVKE